MSSENPRFTNDKPEQVVTAWEGRPTAHLAWRGRLKLSGRCHGDR
jgi:hypothetical protein